MRKIDPKENERIDDLCRDGYMILQDTKGFLFGVDAVLLTDFVKKVPEGGSVLDICSGNGIIPILLAAKTKAGHIDGLEIQEDVVDMASRSVYMNELEERITMTCGDLKEINRYYKAHCFDVVTVNPPYTKESGGLTGENDSRIIARHEVKCSLSDVIKASAKMLKFGGAFFMVHRPQRLVDIMSLMREYQIEPKRMQLSYNTRESEPNLVFIEGRYKGNPELRIEPPLILDEQGEK